MQDSSNNLLMLLCKCYSHESNKSKTDLSIGFHWKLLSFNSPILKSYWVRQKRQMESTSLDIGSQGYHPLIQLFFREFSWLQTIAQTLCRAIKFIRLLHKIALLLCYLIIILSIYLTKDNFNCQFNYSVCILKLLTKKVIEFVGKALNSTLLCFQTLI